MIGVKMDKAKEIYGNGKEKVVNADNIDGRTISYKEKNLFVNIVESM